MTIAGLPQDKDVKWTHLSERTIGDNLADRNQVASRYHVNQMLKYRHYKKRALLKKIALNDVEGRNEQFNKIAAYRTSFTNEGLPVISIDTKKKELLGNFSRLGSAYSILERHTYDHDFLSSADGQIVPHGIYDVNENIGYVTLGLSKDTSEFVCDNLSKCWTETLQYKYPDAETMLLLCDGGGSNASAHYIVKQDLVKLAKSLNINILVAHYPPYCSKWNPIEHRLFSQITHTWSGIALKNIEFVKNLTNTTTTRTGLKVITSINQKQYLNKREVCQKFRDNIQEYITFDDKRPKWNYLIKGRD
jgi:hypothetical protein